MIKTPRHRDPTNCVGLPGIRNFYGYRYSRTLNSDLRPSRLHHHYEREKTTRNCGNLTPWPRPRAPKPRHSPFTERDPSPFASTFRGFYSGCLIVTTLASSFAQKYPRTITRIYAV